MSRAGYDLCLVAADGRDVAIVMQHGRLSPITHANTEKILSAVNAPARSQTGEAECEFPCDYCGSKKHASPNCEKAPIAHSTPASSCPTEQGELVKRLREALGWALDNMNPPFDWEKFKEATTLRWVTEAQAPRQPAPSAVAKDRAEVVERLRFWLTHGIAVEVLRQDLTDAISLLSQPAVAQTEAGNDVRQH